MKQAIFILLFILTSCQKYYVDVCRQKIGRQTLASTFVGSPDPRQKSPPKGENLILEWHVPKESLKENLKLVLNVVYQDRTQATFTHALHHRSGTWVYSLVDQEYMKKKGIFSYQVKVVTADEQSLYSWKHRMWVEIISHD